MLPVSFTTKAYSANRSTLIDPSNYSNKIFGQSNIITRKVMSLTRVVYSRNTHRVGGCRRQVILSWIRLRPKVPKRESMYFCGSPPQRDNCQRTRLMFVSALKGRFSLRVGVVKNWKRIPGEANFARKYAI